MDSYWMNEFNDEDMLLDSNEACDDFYCPYTNGPKCALMIKGWQPQELCDSLDCEQLKHFKHSRRNEAA